MEMPLGHRLRATQGPLLLTGHTGFKGTWATLLLEQLNIPVIGYSLKAHDNSLFCLAERDGAIPEKFADIRNYAELEKFMDDQKPSTIVHMAAQPIVQESYKNPYQTFDVNVMGTVNILDIAFKKKYIQAIIVVTTDKVYKNDDSGELFVETDPLEGKDPYSASKVGVEAAVKAWQQIEKIFGGPKVISVRAGNVIGGGDFASNRIIPDLIRGILKKEIVEIRNPGSIRPWQHVLDPIGGYLLALEGALAGKKIQNLNFGPSDENLSVLQISEIAMEYFPDLQIQIGLNSKLKKMEATNLNLDSNLAKELLKWKTEWTQSESVHKTFQWWKKFTEEPKKVLNHCNEEIEEYLKSDGSKYK